MTNETVPHGDHTLNPAIGELLKDLHGGWCVLSIRQTGQG